MRVILIGLLLLAFPALAEENNPNIIPFPSLMLCGMYNQGERMQDEYGEIPFVEGDAQVFSPEPGKAYDGKIRIFLNPETQSYTIFFDIDDKITCLLTTGNKLEPIYSGQEL
jgi:hypothetical protein